MKTSKTVKVFVGLAVTAALVSFGTINASASTTEEAWSTVQYKSEKPGFTTAYLLEGTAKTTVKTSAT